LTGRIHHDEPIWFYEPIDGNHEFLQWQSISFRWNLWGTGVPSRDEMLDRRNRIMDEIPDWVVIGAHIPTLATEDGT
jgi:hypothetical protein